LFLLWVLAPLFLSFFAAPPLVFLMAWAASVPNQASPACGSSYWFRGWQWRLGWCDVAAVINNQEPDHDANVHEPKCIWVLTLTSQFSAQRAPTICIQRQCGCEIHIIEMKVTLKAYHAASAGTGDLSILFKYYTAMVEFIHFILYFS
jgi:hypothetical protein